MKTLNELCKTDSEASLLCKSTNHFDIIFGIKLLKLLFGYANDVSEYLQKKDIDLISAFDRVCGLKATFQECRTDAKFEQLWQKTVNTCSSLVIDIPQESSIRRSRKVSKSARISRV